MLLCCLWQSAKCSQQIRAYFINAFAQPIAEEDQIYSGICVPLTHYRWPNNISNVITYIVTLLVTMHNYFLELLSIYCFLLKTMLILMKACRLRMGIFPS